MWVVNGFHLTYTRVLVYSWDLLLFQFVLDVLKVRFNTCRWHLADVNVEYTTFWCASNAIDDDCIFQKLFLLERLENRTQNRFTKRRRV
ncbi:hypothetical protein D3C73_1208340 [compost metagenome]